MLVYANLGYFTSLIYMYVRIAVWLQCTVRMAVWLQCVQYVWQCGYNVYSTYDSVATTCTVRMAVWLQRVQYVWQCGYNVYV